MKNSNTLEVRLDRLENRVETGFAELSATLSAKMESLIDNLAISVKNGFDQMVTKEEFEERMAGVDARFDQMDRRFDRIENVSIGGHERRLDNIEDDIRLIKTKVGLRK